MENNDIINNDKYYVHKYGGIYRKITECIYTEICAVLVVYEHVYPFEKKNYARDIDEFNKNFTEITIGQYNDVLKKDKIAFQDEINERKNNGIK